MKFFIDTANLDQIKEAEDLGILDGVTTNPSLMAKEGISGANNILQHYVNICKIVDGPVSAEVIATDFEGMIKGGLNLAELHPNIVVKVPMTKEGLKAIKYFSTKGIKTMYTYIFCWTSSNRSKSWSQLRIPFYWTFRRYFYKWSCAYRTNSINI